MSVANAVALFRTRKAWRQLWLADALSLTGDWFSLVAVSVLSLTATRGGTVALAFTLAAHLLPQSLLSPFAGHLADRVDRRRLLILGSLIEGGLTLGMLEAARRGNIALLQLLLFLRSAVATQREPASGAALPRLVQGHELGIANAVGAATWSVCFAMGMALGGIATQWSPAFALGVDAATFFGAAALLSKLPALPPEPDARAHRSTIAEARTALGLAFGKELRAFVLGKSPVALAAGGGWIALNLVAHQAPSFGGGASTLGVFQSLRGIGTGVGPIVVIWALGRGARRDVLDHLAALFSFGGMIALVLAPSAVFALGGVFLWGIGGGANWVLATTMIQERAPRAYLGRMLGIDALCFTLSMSATALVAAGAIDAGATLRNVTIVTVGVGALAWLALRFRPTPVSEPGASATP